MKLYNLVEEYNGLQQVGLSLKFIRSNLKSIKEILEENKEEWNELK